MGKINWVILREIQLDKNNKPTGILSEGAMNLIRVNFKELDEELEVALKKSLQIMLQFGITSFMDACAKENFVKTYCKVYKG